MALYTAECPICHTREDYIRKIADRHDTPVCSCGEKMFKAVTTCMVPAMAIAESLHIVSPIDNSIMRNKSDYEKHMAKHGVRPSSEYAGHKVEQKSNKEDIAQAVSAAYDKVIGG